MNTQQRIEKVLMHALSPDYLEVTNESHGHNVPKGSETHFKVVVVAACFQGLGRVARHRQVYDVLTAELEAGVHALAMHCHTPAEWQARGQQVLASPPCLGGGRQGLNSEPAG